MPIYLVKTISEEGVVESRDRNAPNITALEKNLEKEGKILLKVQEKPSLQKSLGSRGKVRTNDLIDLLIYLSITSSSGIPLPTALEDFIEQVKNLKLKGILTDVLLQVSQGLTFSESLSKYEHYFGLIFINTVRAGEETGSLDVVLDKLRGQLDWQTKIKATMKQALIYPSFLIFAVIGLVVLLLTFLLPRIMGIYTESNMELPAMTKVLITTSNFLRGNMLLLLFFVVSLPVTIIIMRKTKGGRTFMDKMILRIPVMGNIIAEICLARFTVIFKTMLYSGVEIVRSLEISGSSSGNSFIEDLCRQAIHDVRNGERLSAAMDRFKSLNFVLPRMVSIGEKTGRIVDALECAYKYFDSSIPKKVSRMISLIEPSIIILAGVLVGFILIGALMPIYTMYSAF